MSTVPNRDDSSLVEVRGITHEFAQPGGQALRVLERIDFVIRPREVVAFLGPSGCGKSTLLRILAGLLVPTSGQVLAHGRPLEGLNPAVAIVFQSFALFPWMSVEDNIRTVLAARGVPDRQARDRVESVIQAVGLAGFENAYPRELSGGMKQRVGMARALVVEPELLFMDEPFSQVDAFTAEGLRAEVIDLWSKGDRGPSSVLLVSHDIKEVAYMADRIVVLAANPGRIRTVVENRLPRPRDYRSAELVRLVDELHEIITGGEMPDTPAPAAAPPGMQPVPDVAPGEIVGLLEYLDARGGVQDLFTIVSETHREFGHVIAVVKAAEMLDFVDTPRQSVALAPTGRRFVAADSHARQLQWREQLMRLTLFQQIVHALERAEDQVLDHDVVLESIAMSMPSENFERVLQTVVSWGRWGGLVDYDERAETVCLVEPEARPST